MQYDLVKHRGYVANDATPSMELLYYYSKYRKDREQKPPGNGRQVVRVGKDYVA